jgi:hypothetical protein
LAKKLELPRRTNKIKLVRKGKQNGKEDKKKTPDGAGEISF